MSRVLPFRYGFKQAEEDGPVLATGGRDGVVKLTGTDLEPRVTINLKDEQKFGSFR